jgi:hypothetical protein
LKCLALASDCNFSAWRLFLTQKAKTRAMEHIENEAEEANFQSFFVESKEVIQLIDSLVSIAQSKDNKALQKRVDEITKIV